MKKGFATLATVCVIVVAFVFQSHCAIAAPKPVQETDFWEMANSFYLKKNWDSAAFYYNKIVAAGNADAAVYYNLGNAHYKLGHTGAAVLNYERALLRKPDYKVAAENLELAQTRIPSRLQPPEDASFVQWWQALSAPATSVVWAITAILLFTLALILLWGKRQRRARIPVQLIVASFILWGLCLTMALLSATNGTSSDKAVVIRPKAVLKTSDGKNIIGVPEGTVVSRKSEVAGSVEVVLPDGRDGWLQQREIAAVD